MTEITVVLVNGSQSIRAGMRGLFNETSDIQVVGETGDSLNAAKVVEKSQPDVLILALSINESKELQVVWDIRHNHNATKILVTSSFDSEGIAEAAFKSGASGYLPKDEIPDQLIEAVRSIDQGETRWLSKNMHRRFRGNGEWN